jgi:hypothetical protein
MWSGAVRLDATAGDQRIPACKPVIASRLGDAVTGRIGPRPQWSGRSFVEDWLWPALSLAETTMRSVPVELDLSVIVSR